MGLYERLLGLEAPVIGTHEFYSLMTERRRGQVTNQQVIDALGLSAGEQAELQTLVTRVTGNFLTGPEIHEVILLAREKLIYLSVAAVKTRLGV